MIKKGGNIYLCNYIQSIDDNIHIYEEKLPQSVKAFIVAGNDTEYTIYINQSLSYESRLKAIAHEIKHIKNKDLYTDGSAIKKEQEI